VEAIRKLRYRAPAAPAPADWVAVAAFIASRGNPDSSLAYIHLLGREMAAKLPKACGIVHAWRVTMVAGEGHRPGHSERAPHPAGPRPQFSLGELLQSRKHRFPSRASKYLVVAYWGSTSPQLRGGR
jgi:hypothetical protein